MTGSRVTRIHYVTGLILDDAGRALLGLHARDGLWGTIGGGLAISEDPRTGLVREIQEETGIWSTVGALLNAHSGPLTTAVYSSGERVSALALVFRCSIPPGSAPCPDGIELTELRWFTVENAGGIPLKPWMSLVVNDWRTELALDDDARRRAAAGVSRTS